MEKCLKNLLEIQELIDTISCVLLIHTQKNNPSKHDDGIRGGIYPIPSNSTTEALVSLIATIHFISCWLQALEKHFLERFNMYVFVMKNMFQKIPVELPKAPSPK